MAFLDVDPSATRRENLCLALDMADRAEILKIVDELRDLVGYFKINSAFTLHGPDLVRELLDRDVKIFLDLKVHDIPNTLAGYGRAVTELGVHVVTVHTAGGTDMMRAIAESAAATAQRTGLARPKLIGVTVLTSIDQHRLNHELHIDGSVEEEIRRRAKLAAAAGLDGIVCAPAEIDLVRDLLPADFYYVTPGARSPGTDSDDHHRIGTHAQAIAAGAGLLVIGRRVLQAPDRRRAVQEIESEIEEALGVRAP